MNVPHDDRIIRSGGNYDPNLTFSEDACVLQWNVCMLVFNDDCDRSQPILHPTPGLITPRLGRSSHAGSMWIGNITHTIEFCLTCV